MPRSNSLDRTIFALTSACPSCGVHFDEPELICPHDGTLLASGLQPGVVIDGRYRYLAALGNGGMGLIVKAEDKETNDIVAVKMLLRSNNKAEILRFEQESRAAKLLDHPNIIGMRDFGVTKDGCPYLVMDYLDGFDLATLLSKQGTVGLLEAIEIIDQICHAMSFAHSKGVLHRDLKPSNIMLIRNSAKTVVKIVDFGIAKIISGDGTAERNLTQTGQILGSPLYMSPEQALGKPVDARTDVYSAACVFYHMITGAPPIAGESSIETLFKHVNFVPLRLSEASIGKEFPAALEDVVARALSKELADRQSSFDQFNKEIHQSIKTATLTKETEVTASRPPKQILQTTIALALVIILSTVGAYLYQKQKTVEKSVTERVSSSPKNENKIAKQSISPDDPKESNTANLLDLGLTGDGIAKTTLQVLLQQKSQFIDFKTNEKSVTNQTIESLVSQLRSSPGRLRSLDLTETGITDDGIQLLLKLKPKNLKSLSIGHSKVSASGLKAISQLSSLENLDIHGLKGLKSDSLTCLGNLRALKLLNFSNCYPETKKPTAVGFLQRLHSLESLNASSNSHGIDDESTITISKMPGLKFLDLSWSTVGDVGLTRLGNNIDQLETLSLSGRTISDRSIPIFAHAGNLKTLTLNEQPITNGALKQFAHLYEQNKMDLNRLDLVGCRLLSAEDCSQLQLVMRHCTVNWNLSQH